jgi:DNA repair protein RadC
MTMKMSDLTNIPVQLPLIDMTGKQQRKSDSRQCHKVQQTLAKLNALHDELNAQLYSRPVERPTINSPADAASLVMPFIGNLDHEELWVILMDTRNRVKTLVALYRGSVNTSQVRVAEVFRQVITENALAIILAHNHPSGDPTPSPDDVCLTRSIVQAGQLLDILLLDHIIVSGMSGTSYVSLKERGVGFS